MTLDVVDLSVQEKGFTERGVFHDFVSSFCTFLVYLSWLCVGMMYVALSRATTLQGLHIAEFHKSMVKVDQVGYDFERRQFDCSNVVKWTNEPTWVEANRILKNRKSQENERDRNEQQNKQKGVSNRSIIPRWPGGRREGRGGEGEGRSGARKRLLGPTAFSLLAPPDSPGI